MFIQLGKNWEVDLSTTEPTDGVSVPVVDGFDMAPVIIDGEPTDGFTSELVYILSQIEDQRLSAEHGRPVSGQVAPPDPWLIVLTVMMWEGIVQGLTWDVVKTPITKALGYLQSNGVAPKGIEDRETFRDIRVRWSSYLNIGHLASLFMRLEFRYKSMTELERDEMPRLDPDNPKRRKKKR